MVSICFDGFEINPHLFCFCFNRFAYDGEDILGQNTSAILRGYDEMCIEQRATVRMSAICFLVGFEFHDVGFVL